MKTAREMTDLIGQTPLIYLKRLSQLTGNHIYGKAEFLNPGGSVKDRSALGMILAAESAGQLSPGQTLYEGTAGNTGIGLALVAKSRGYACHLVMPDNQAQEKYAYLQALGAKVTLVKPVPFANSAHFYHQARQFAEKDPQGFWINQFENPANFNFHLQTTGPEIWEQTQGKIHFFGCAAGTGGTIAGVSQFLKSKNNQIKTYLFDPMGSGLHNYIQTGQLTSSGSSVTEGIGIMRLTENFKKAQIDGSLLIDDTQMISMLYDLAYTEGLFLGPSAALNVFGTYQWASLHAGQGLSLVTILCDSGNRYQSKILNTEWLKEKNLRPVDIETLV